MTKVLLAFRHPKGDDPYACHVGLGVTANSIVMTLSEHRIDAAAKPVANGEELWANLLNEWSEYTHIVMLAPFIDADFLTRLFLAFPHKTFTLTYHSNVGFLTVDSFATSELPAYLMAQETCPNFQVSANSIELTRAIVYGVGHNCLYLPNLYPLLGKVARTRTPWAKPHPLKIGLFGAIRILKNPLTAAWASLIIQSKLDADVELHMSLGRDEGGGPSVNCIRSIVGMSPRVKLIDIGWQNWDDFGRTVQQMDLLLQPSFTESFNNVSADGAARGVPCVVSDAIDWAPHEWKAKADSAYDVAAVGMKLLKDKHAGRKGWEALDSFVNHGFNHWKLWLGIK